MSSVCRPLAVAAWAFWLSVVAFGQPPASLGPPTLGGWQFSNPYGRSLTLLTTNPDVRKELRLTDDQWEKIQQAQEEMRKKVGELYRSRELNQRDSRKRQQAYREKIQALSEEAENKARSILSEKQVARLQQIIRQRQMQMDPTSFGILNVLLDKEVDEALHLTDEQRDQLRRKQTEVFAENKRKREEFSRQLRAETREKMFGVLTEDQRKTLDGLLGPEFRLKLPERRSPAAESAAEPSKR